MKQPSIRIPQQYRTFYISVSSLLGAILYVWIVNTNTVYMCGYNICELPYTGFISGKRNINRYVQSFSQSKSNLRKPLCISSAISINAASYFDIMNTCRQDTIIFYTLKMDLEIYFVKFTAMAAILMRQKFNFIIHILHNINI